MAHFIGNAGDTPKEKAIKQRLNVLIAIYLAMAAGFFLLGYATSKWSFWWSLATILILVPTAKFLERRWDRHLHFAHCHETGATGEREIIPFLKNLPDTYTVICNLEFADSYGDIDHLVIGPTGIFSIDVKNWKGTVAADGAGELLLNGKPTDKPQVRTFTARTMDLKERLKALTRLDPYIQCLFVFPHTYLEARWGTTGTVKCVDTDNLVALITKPNPTRTIPAADLSRLVKAATALKDSIATKPRTKNEEQRTD